MTKEAAPAKMRILCLHGFTQSGALFRTKTRALEKALQKRFPAAPKPGSLPSYPGGVEFVYPTGHVRVQHARFPSDDDDHGDAEAREEAWGWWLHREARPGTAMPSRLLPGQEYHLDGLDESIENLKGFMREQGPFAGVLGFSQGAALAVMLACLLEGGGDAAVRAGREGGSAVEDGGEGAGREATGGDGPVRHQLQPFRFAVVCSGFRAPLGTALDAVYARGLAAPSLHLIGTVDTIVSEERSLALVEACRFGNDAPPAAGKGAAGEGREKGSSGGGGEAESRHRVLYHPGGHFVPAGQKGPADAVAGFIMEALAGQRENCGGKGAAAEKEERVEDMDMPF